MIVSATHDARHAATAASAALPPSARISAPASAVAGWPAATAGEITRVSRPRREDDRLRGLPPPGRSCLFVSPLLLDQFIKLLVLFEDPCDVLIVVKLASLPTTAEQEPRGGGDRVDPDRELDQDPPHRYFPSTDAGSHGHVPVQMICTL